MWALPWAPAFVLHGHPSGCVRLLQSGPKIIGSEPLRCWRGCPDGAGCALGCFAAYLVIEGGDGNRRIENPVLGRLVAVRLEEPGDLNIGNFEGHSFEGDENFCLSWSKGVEGVVVEIT